MAFEDFRLFLEKFGKRSQKFSIIPPGFFLFQNDRRVMKLLYAENEDRFLGHLWVKNVSETWKNRTQQL